jgi:hypothetical protein
MRTVRRLCALFLALLLPLAPLAPASAQYSDDTGIITINVVDAATKKPLQDASITLYGSTQARSLTNKSGVVKYTDVPTGIYQIRVTKGGFSTSQSPRFEVLGNKEVELDINMGPQIARIGTATASTATTATTDASTGLTIIGTTQAKVIVNTRDVDQDSAIRRVSDSLVDALSKIAGVDVTVASSDPDAAQTISLNGHDESQTAVSLDGIPLGAPGSAVNLRGINSGLFAGASVNTTAQAGSLGGSVNFRTLQPTLTWVSRFSVKYGTFDKFDYQLGETGSIGKLGVAIMHSTTEGNNPLTFNTFTDQSGLTYPHAGESTSVGSYVKLRYGLGDKTTLNATVLQNNNGTSSLCTQDVTLLPCGIGPGNTTASAYQLADVQVQSLVGETALSLTDYVQSTNSFTNDALRTIDGTVTPLVANSQMLSHGVSLLATINQHKSTWTASGYAQSTTTTFNPIINSSAFVVPSSFTSTAVTGQLADQYKVNDRLTIGPTASLADVTGGTSLQGGFAFQWRPVGTETFTGNASVGSSQSANGLIRTFSDPASARFNCAAGTANVSGPGDLPGPQSAVSYDATWTHVWKFGQFRLDLFRQTQADQLINAQIVATSLGFNSSSPYIQALNGFYQTPTTCGAGAVLDPNNVYVSEPIGDMTRQYQGLTFQGRLALGPHLVMIPAYSVNSAIVTGADQRLASLNSTTIIGSQISGRPLHRGNITLDGDLPHLGLELISNVTYVGPNNSQHLDPYVTVNLGASHLLGQGRLVFLASNLFNTESGALSSLAFAQPIATSGGSQLFVAAVPNTPRQFSFTYSFNTGARSGAGGARQSRTAAASAAASSAAALAGQGTAQQRARGLGAFQPYPPPDGVDPLSVADKRDSCKPEDATIAAPVLAELKAAVDAYKAGKPIPEMEGLRLTPHGAPTSPNLYFEVAANIPQQPGQNGQPGANGGRGGRGGGGFGGGGAPGGPGGAPGEGQTGPIVPNGPITVDPRPQPTGSPGPRPTANPVFRAAFEKFRATISCAYFSVLTQDDAKAKGFAEFRGRATLAYAPGIGLFAVRPPAPPQLGTGGGSVKK